MLKKLLLISIFSIYSHLFCYHNLGLLVNIPQNNKLESSSGLGVLYSYSFENFFDKYKSISLQSSLQISKFKTNTQNSINDGVDAEIKTKEKLLSLSFGPRFEFKENFYFGFSLTHNSFYEKLQGDFKWVDSSIGECTAYEEMYDECEENVIQSMIWDLGLSAGVTAASLVVNEIMGFVTSLNRYTGFSLHLGVFNADYWTLEMSYNTMPSLKRVLSSDDNGFLLDYVSSDYFSINFSVPLK